VVYTLEPVPYGNLISQSRSGTDSFYLFDVLGSTRELTNSMGSVTQSYIFDSFGNALLTGTTSNPYLYTGRLGYYFNSDLGTYYVRNRYYAPLAAVFLTLDPLVPSNERYRSYHYALNDPVNLTDPTGLWVQCTCVSTSVQGCSSRCTVVKSAEECDLSAMGYSCTSAPIPGGGPYVPMQGRDPTCPLLARAIAVANAVIRRAGACQRWFDSHGGPKCGPFPVSVIPNWNPFCWGGPPTWNFFASGSILVCRYKCSSTLADLATILVHEYAHSWCVPVIGISEPCATSAQDACIDEITDITSGPIKL
jgi:RHS repeat-associated protein